MKQNFTCESDSPLIAYTGAWAAHVGNVPASLNSYVMISYDCPDVLLTTARVSSSSAVSMVSNTTSVQCLQQIHYFILQ